MKSPGTRLATNERKYFSQTAQREAVEVVLQGAGDARGADRLGKGHQGLLNVGLVMEPVLPAGPGRVLGACCSLLAVASVVQHLLGAAVSSGWVIALCSCRLRKQHSCLLSFLLSQ